MDYNQTPATKKNINLLDLILIIAGVLVVVLLLVLGYFGIRYLTPQATSQNNSTTQNTNVPVNPVTNTTGIQPKIPPITPMPPIIVATTTTGGILMYGQISNIFLGSVTITKIPLSTISATLKMSAIFEPDQVHYSSGSASLSVPQSLFKGDIKTGDFANVYGDANSVTQIDILR